MRNTKQAYRLAEMFTVNQLARMFDRVMPESTGWPNYGWDIPTLKMTYPEKIQWLRDISDAHKMRIEQDSQ